ncbi:MAG: cell division topological specificity factor MinE [Lachnospiraceae bacterium]|nr:cell division topological specificity factor MinE [Lachnospiraceae bacterium]
MVFDLSKVLSFRFNSFHKRKSGKIAKERLRVLLIADRSGCSPEIMEQIKIEIFNVVSKYIEIDKEDSIVEIEKSKTPYIFANIPIKEVKYK